MDKQNARRLAIAGFIPNDFISILRLHEPTFKSAYQFRSSLRLVTTPSFAARIMGTL